MASPTSKKLLSNFVALGIVQGANFILPILVMPFVLRKIGTGMFGVVSVAQVVMVFLSTVADYGFNLTATREVSINKSDPDRISRILSTVLGSKMLICGLCFGVLLIFMPLIPVLNEHRSLYLLGFVYVAGQAFIPGWLFQGMEKMQYITVTTLFARLLFIFMVFFFIKRPGDYVYFLFFLGSSNLIAGIFSIWLAFRLFRLRVLVPEWGFIRTELTEGWQITASNLSINTYQYVNIIILRLLTNDITVGYYSIAERIFFAARQVLGIFSQVVYPHICQLAREGIRESSKFFRQFYLPFLILVLLGSAGLFILSPGIINIFLGREEHVPSLLLRMLAFVPVIVCLNIPAYQILLAFDRKKSYFRILFSGTVISMLSSFWLCKFFGAAGTVASIILTELFVTSGLIWALYKNKLQAYVRSPIL